MEDNYKTLAERSEGLFKDRGSKFYAYAQNIDTEEESQLFLEDIKKLHNKARHHCYAYRIGMDDNNFRSNDDGEPSGTAGRPILGQIDSFELRNVMIIVVRYFGGTKLGTSGLINAYKEAAKMALEKAKVVEKIIEDKIEIKFEYSKMSEVMNAIKKIEPSIYKQDFGNIGHIIFGVRQSETADTLLRFKALVMGISLEEAQTIETIPDLEIELKGP